MGAKGRMRLLLPVLVLFLSDISNAELPAPEITVTRTGEGLEVSWTEVDASTVEDCFLLYVFTHQVNGVNVSHEILQDRVISVPLEPCVDNHFIVRPRCVTGAVVAATATKDYFTSITENLKVENVQLQFEEGNSILASWSRPEDSRACQILYLVRATHGGKKSEYATTGTSLGLSPVPPCETLEVTVTPLDLEVVGQSNAASITAPPGSDVGSLRSISMNNGRIEWTSGDDSACEVSYTVTVRDNFGRELAQSTTTERSLEFDFAYCAMYNIMVSSSFENAHITSVFASHRPRPAEVAEVENIVVSEEDGNILVSWTPVAFGECKTHYKLRHYLNGVLVGAALSEETSRSFVTNYCADNRISVQAVVDMMMGVETVTNFIAASREPEPISNLVVVKTDGALTASWNPVTVGFCSIEYVVEHTVSGKVIQSSTVTSNSISLQRHSCSDNTIRVTPVAGTHKGSSMSERIKVGLESLNAVKSLDVEEVSDGLLVSWDPIEEGFCDIVYTITNFDGENTNVYQTGLTSYTIQRTNCAKNTISVTAAEPNTQVTSSPSYRAINVDIDLTKVRYLNVIRKSKDTLDIDWKRPADSENCDLSYVVSVAVGNETVLTKATTDTQLSVNVDIKPCQVFDVILTPVSPAGAKGPRSNRDDIAHLFSLNPPWNLGKNDGILSWRKPRDIGLCEVYFHVNIFNEFGELVREARVQETEVDFQMTPCRQYTPSVRAVDVLTGLESEEIVAEKIGEARILTQISTLEFFNLEPERLNVAWGAVDTGDCPVLYEVSQTIDENEVFVFLTNETFEILDVPACTSNEIGVMPILEDGSLTGDRFTHTVAVGLDVLAQVGDIIVLPSGVAWDAPMFSGRCQIEYEVKIFDAKELVATFATSDLLIEWAFIPCGEYTVHITPTHLGRAGPSAEVTFTAQEVDHAPPIHLNTETTLTSAVITFEANSRVVTNCPIEAVTITCNDHSDDTISRTVAVKDNVARIFEVSLSGLKPNTHFSCVAEWSPHTSAPSETFEFITRYIPVTNFEVSNVTSNDFTINWEDPQGLERYVKYFAVVIESQGPNHFVQESCDIDRYRTYRFEVALGEGTFTFNDARPNFKYHVSLVTRFTIGVDKKADIIAVNTLPGVPGPITDLSPVFNLVKCAEYLGDGAFVWTPPCDINGDLDRFEATLTTLYTVGGEERSHTTQITLTPENVEDYTFSAQMPTLNPFFKYSISIDVFASYPGYEPSTLTSISPPPAFTYCSH